MTSLELALDDRKSIRKRYGARRWLLDYTGFNRKF